MRPVPEEIRRINQHGQQHRGAKARQMATLVTVDREEEKRRDHPIRHRVFGKEPEAAGDADQPPPALAARFPRPHESVERDRPAEEQRRVGRHDDGRDPNPGRVA